MDSVQSGGQSRQRWFSRSYQNEHQTQTGYFKVMSTIPMPMERAIVFSDASTFFSQRLQDRKENQSGDT